MNHRPNAIDRSIAQVKRLFALAGLSFFLAGFLSLPSHAVQISPTYQIFEAKPGQTITGELTLTNTDGADLRVTPEARDWVKPPVKQTFKTSDWLKIDGTKFVLKDGQSKTMNFTVTAPKDARGEVMGVLSFSTKNTYAEMVTFKLSVAIYLQIAGTLKRDLDVAAVSVKLSSNTDVGIYFENKGNVHVRPRGLIEIIDSTDQIVGNIVVDKAQPIFPGKPQIFYGTIKDYRLGADNYTMRITLRDMDGNVDFPTWIRKFSVGADGQVKEIKAK